VTAAVTDSTANQNPGNPLLITAIREDIARSGSIPFARFMELALYHPEHGYYVAPARRPGRGGDFLTAPEMHPLFGLTIARQILECIDRMGNPEPFTILEYGSGIGGLAYDVIVGILQERPELQPYLRYRLNEVNPHRTAQALSAMDEVGLGDVVDIDDGTTPVTGVILANEVADAMPVHRLRWTGSAFEEAWVTWDDGAGFLDRFGPLSSEVEAFDPATYLASAGLDLAALPSGSLVEVAPAMDAWVRDIASRLQRGYAFIVDYGYPAAQLYSEHRLESTLRIYSEHTVTDKPYEGVGERDMTAHVDFTRLMTTAREAGLEVAGLATQSDFLSNAGLGELLVRLQQQPDMALDEYYRAQASVFRLIDPGGMGRFRVLGLARIAPVDPPLRGFSGPELPASLQW
jgi:SAM-dependent MidA family methyltransferase